MVFLVDKYKPSESTFDSTLLHNNIYKRLKLMSKDRGIPHIIFYGPPGSGKKTMVNAFLQMIYGKSITKLRETEYEIPGSGNKKRTEVVRNSQHHIIINPTGTNFDKYLVHEIIKKYAMTSTIDYIQEATSKFRVIQISNVEKLSHSAQTSLRQMIEKNADKCRFIMICNNIGNVIGPLVSRCIQIRIPRPSSHKLFAFLVDTSIRHGGDPTFNDIDTIVKLSERNIKTALWYIEMANLKYDFRSKLNNYYIVIESIVTLILTCNINEIENIRNILFNIMMSNYDASKILKDIEFKLIDSDKLNDSAKLNIILKASQVDYNLIRGRRNIIHFDAFVVNVMKIINLMNK